MQYIYKGESIQGKGVNFSVEFVFELDAKNDGNIIEEAPSEGQK